MNVLYPLYLAGILAAAIPIAIHLLTKRQRKHIVFSDLSLLRQVDAEEAPRIQWEHLRLMILRALMCAVLALLFCQPVFKKGEGLLRRPGQGTVAAIVLDNSRSMGASEGGVLRFEKARKEALSVLDLLRGEDEAIALFASSRIRNSHSVPTSFREEVRESVELAEVTEFASAFSQAVSLAVQAVLKSPLPNKEIYLFTDCQKTALLPAPTSWPEGSDEISGYFGYHPDSLNLPNMELANLDMEPVTAKAGDNVSIKAEVIAHGEDVPSAVDVELQVGPTHRLPRKVSIVSNQTSQVVFPDFTRSDRPVDTGLVRMQADVLESDNELHMALPESRPISVLITQGAGDESTLLNFWAALRILATQPIIPAIEAKGSKTGNVPRELIERSADVLVIANPGKVDERWIRSVTNWIREGGNIVLALGPVVGSWINTVLVPTWIPHPVNRWDLPKDQPSRPSALEFSHPWLDRFEDQESADWTSVNVWGGWEFTGEAARINPLVSNLIVLDRENPTPLLWERTIGFGTLHVWMSSLDDAWNDLPRESLYVAFWGEYLRSLAEKKGLRPYFTAGQQVPIEVVRKDEKPAEIRIAGPEGKEHVLAISGEELIQTLHFSRTNKAGVYEIQFSDERVEEVTPRAFAVNVEPGEGDLTALSVEEVKALYQFPIQKIHAGSSLAGQIHSSRYGYGLWPYVLAFLGLMMMLEAWWGRVD